MGSVFEPLLPNRISQISKVFAREDAISARTSFYSFNLYWRYLIQSEDFHLKVLELIVSHY